MVCVDAGGQPCRSLIAAICRSSSRVLSGAPARPLLLTRGLAAPRPAAAAHRTAAGEIVIAAAARGLLLSRRAGLLRATRRGLRLLQVLAAGGRLRRQRNRMGNPRGELVDELARCQFTRLNPGKRARYVDHLGGATGILVKDYRGKNAEQEIWKFDAAMVAQILDTLKQAAIEEWAVDREARSEG